MDDILNILRVTKNTKIELAVALAFCLGLRGSEICGLTWDCVDLYKETIGHATNSTLKNVYQHTINQEKEKINKKINGYFDNVLECLSHE